jgi:hypothetical protein
MARPKTGNLTKGWKKPELTTKQKRDIFHTCIQAELRGGIKKGFFKSLSSNLPVSARTVSATWKKMRDKYEEKVRPVATTNPDNVMNCLPDEFFATSKSLGSNADNRRLWQAEQVGLAMAECPKSARQTLQATAAAIGMPKTSFERLMKKEEAAVRHSSSLKPTLTDTNKWARIEFCLSKIQSHRGGRTMWYKDDHNDVQVDEKWFNLTYDGTTYYLAPWEEKPTRRTRHKGYIDKVMFLAAVARPRQLPNGTWFDGKLGIWPFGSFKPAKRDSVRRKKGTLEWQNESVDADSYRSMLMNEVVPSICANWPDADFRSAATINIQQDGAGAHVTGNCPVWKAYLEEMGLSEKIKLYEQAANSPDLNVCDLGLFNAIEKAYQKECPSGFSDIIECVKKCYWEFPMEKLNHLWLTRMQCMNEILKSGGDNIYKIPHMGKQKLERQGNLPRVIQVVEEARNFM